MCKMADEVQIFICGLPEDFQGGEEPLLEYYTINPEMEAAIAEHELRLDLDREEELCSTIEVEQPEIIPADVARASPWLRGLHTLRWNDWLRDL